MNKIDEKFLEGNVRIPSGCAIFAAISRKGRKFTGSKIINSIKLMHDRSNGLGGGFAGYGIYPMYKDFYAFHVFYNNKETQKNCEAYLKDNFEIIHLEVIPTKKCPNITDEPIIYRYFLAPLKSKILSMQVDEKEYVVRHVMHINTKLKGVYIFSSGKNMGTFKAVGYPEDIGEFYMLDSYEGYSWTCHGRYPTNTPGWWGGAHPFSLLDYSIVHNGEISSYDANRRFIEMFGYKCTLQTDTEVITYILDYLIRRKGLNLEEVSNIIAAPFWTTIDKKTKEEKEKLTFLRIMFSSLLITGPFSIILGFNGGILALNDRLKLRSMVVGEKDDMVYISSEEAPIRAIESSLDKIFAPGGGEPFIIKIKDGLY